MPTFSTYGRGARVDGPARIRRASSPPARSVARLPVAAPLLVAVLLAGLACGSGGRPDCGVERAFSLRSSDVVVQCEGEVARILPDDVRGSRHQRFVVALGPRLTVLVSHNIDLASRIPDLEVGDRVRFRGEYEWNELGGVVHWTHRDPEEARPDGWIEHGGERYR